MRLILLALSAAACAGSPSPAPTGDLAGKEPISEPVYTAPAVVPFDPSLLRGEMVALRIPHPAALQLLPGDRVDVLSVDGERTEVLLQNLLVLAGSEQQTTVAAVPAMVDAVTERATNEFRLVARHSCRLGEDLDLPEIDDVDLITEARRRRVRRSAR